MWFYMKYIKWKTSACQYFWPITVHSPCNHLITCDINMFNSLQMSTNMTDHECFKFNRKQINFYNKPTIATSTFIALVLTVDFTVTFPWCWDTLLITTGKLIFFTVFIVWKYRKMYMYIKIYFSRKSPTSLLYIK